MADRLSELEARLERVEEALRAISLGIAAGRGGPVELEPKPTLTLAMARDGPDAIALLTLTGRTLMVLGGAFLLRALTESGRVPLRLGIGLGLAYAALWLGAAEHAGRRRASSGLFHGLAAVLIAFPIIWEACTHFALLSHEVSAVILAAASGMALAVSWHRRLPLLAGVVVLGTIGASAAFIVQTGRPLPFAAGLLCLAIQTLWMAETRTWSWLLWPPALAIDALTVGLTTRAALAVPLELPAAVISLQSAVATVYLGVMAWRTLARHEALRTFDAIQVPLSLIIGLAGALAVTGTHFPALRSATLVVMFGVAAAGYGVALGPLWRTAGLPAFRFYLSISLTLVLAGLAAAAPPWRTVSLLALAIGGAALGSRLGQPALLLHAAVFAVAAGWSAGLGRLVAASWFAVGAWPSIHALEIAALAVGALAYVLWSVPQSGAGRSARGGRFILALYLVAGTGALAVRLVPALTGHASASPADVGVIRTVTASIAALLLARLGRVEPCVEFGWLVYPMLAAGALSIVIDMPRSTPDRLFVALGVYGAALIVAPRIGRARAR